MVFRNNTAPRREVVAQATRLSQQSLEERVQRREPLATRGRDQTLLARCRIDLWSSRAALTALIDLFRRTVQGRRGDSQIVVRSHSVVYRLQSEQRQHVPRAVVPTVGRRTQDRFAKIPKLWFLNGERVGDTQCTRGSRVCVRSWSLVGFQ